MPVKLAVASARHQGAASPASAETQITPPASSPTNRSRSLGSLINPMSFSQRTADAAV